MAITRLRLQRFSAFDEFDFEPSPGINVLIGANGTGKTHLMKVAYAACDVSKTGASFAEKLLRVFLPSGGALGRLVKRQQGSSRCLLEVHRRRGRGSAKLTASFSNHASVPKSATVRGAKIWYGAPLESVFIPVKEMLANAPGFRSLYAQREVHFEEVYADVLDRAYRPALRGAPDQYRKRLMEILQRAMAGTVTVRNEEFFHYSRQGRLEFSLLAEGMRKLGLLWLLVQNGTLLKGSVLFWDEPETNLHPRLFGGLADIFVQLQQAGIQLFLATHDYTMLKELDHRVSAQGESEVAFHSLYRDPDSGRVLGRTSRTYAAIAPNTIADVFSDLYDREVARSLEDLGR